MAELTLDKVILQDIVQKKWTGPALRRQAVHYAVQCYGISQRRACEHLKHPRSVHYYRSRKDPRLGLRARMREIAQTRIRYGYRRIHVLLRREGWRAGKHLVYRLYREEQLQLRCKRPKRRKMVVARRERLQARRPNEAWALDFVADQLVSGCRFRALTIVDVFSPEALAIAVGQRLGADNVVDALNRLVAQRRAPKVIFADNGGEFTGRLLDLWAYHHKVQIDFRRPGKPTDNSFVESFNGSLRDECLNVNWFESMDDAKQSIEAWRVEYNESRPHMGLAGLGRSDEDHNRRKPMLRLVRRTEALHNRRKLTINLDRRRGALQVLIAPMNYRSGLQGTKLKWLLRSRCQVGS